LIIIIFCTMTMKRRSSKNNEKGHNCNEEDVPIHNNSFGSILNTQLLENTAYHEKKIWCKLPAVTCKKMRIKNAIIYV